MIGSYLQDWLFHDSDFNWRVLEEQGGSLRAVADIGTHWLDLITWMTGLEVESVCADLRTVIPVRHKPTGPSETSRASWARGVRPSRWPIHTEDAGRCCCAFRRASGCSPCRR